MNAFKISIPDSDGLFKDHTILKKYKKSSIRQPRQYILTQLPLSKIDRNSIL